MVTFTLTRRLVVVAVAAFLALTALSVTALVVSLSKPAEAVHWYSDVPTNSFFHASTAWLADNDIADGYSDGTFRTASPITRGQAAYWLRNYNQTLTTHTESSNPGASTFFQKTTNCPFGKVPIAGGGQTNSGNMLITDSYPTGNGWVVRWESDNDAVLDPTSVTVKVICKPAFA